MPAAPATVKRLDRRVAGNHYSAFYSVEGFEEMRVKGAREARRVILGEPVRNPVNRHCLVSPRAAVWALLRSFRR